ncbi:GEVED domain-containing protein [Kaistella jeonii]|uniref:Uncharacterized protein n=1 Tax=Kaistella jeonii TaxID=266749 RepID=A0A0C1FMG8_9FLAO|nr:GEVED domain-containing protein [Kaistella jeonii]KIA89134.1 hypothetical protein OA86_08725 [Kaistella jeonii]SFB93565.1 Por secretion system C-terminal sorting domain-containing protein [Kaistella jeonii]VEI97049.1 Por secretion system C-terminal sorting domain [Kaistella jeonii]
MKTSLQSLKILLAVFFGFLATNAFGQAATATWLLNAANTTTSAVTGNVTATASTTTGVTTSPTPFNTRGWGKNGWDVDNTLNTGTYYEFTVSPTSGNSLSVTGFTYDGSYNGSISIKGDVYYSTDNFGTYTQIGTTSLFTSTTPVPINTTGLTIPVAATGTIKFRIYFYYSDTGGSTRIKNVKVTGTTTATACSGTPAPGSTVASVNPVPGGSSTTLSLQNLTAGSGVTYQWKSSTAFGGPYNNISGANSSTYVASPTAATYYQCVVTCGGSSGTSTPLLVNIAYCTATSTNNTRYIVDFSTTGGVANITNIGTSGGITTTGYSDYTTKFVSQVQGGVINISTDFSGTTDTFGFGLWVDWNDNGDFLDPGEYLLNSGGVPITGGAGSFTVPIGAAVGNHRMRIRNDSDLANATSCGNIAYGEAEDYTVTVLAASLCTGTPTAGTTVLTPSTGIPSSAFVATITGSSGGTGLSYQWQIANALAGNYTDISGQTGASANLNAVPLPGTTKYYRRKITCSGSGFFSFSVGVPFTTTTPTYCTPTTSSPTKTYIKSFKFVGTLNDPPLSANVTGASGYANYTALTPIAQQPDGKVMNIEAISFGTIISGSSYGNGNWKAYVDWNGDGDFADSGEQVYSLTTFVTNALTFGFVIPPGQAAGKYRFRIIVNNDGTDTFDSCSSFINGEVEDYSFEVVYNCPASVDAINIVAADGHRCGTGTVNLSASGTGTNYKWYTTLTGGSAIFTGSNYTTASLNATTVYYVTAINGSCESAYRIPVTARIDPEPVVNITTPAPICGTGFSGVQLTSSGDQYVDIIVDEKFNSGLGVFSSSTLGAYTDVSGTWQNRPSPYIPSVPPYAGLAPALSSGYFGGNYAAIITDIDRGTSILNELKLTSNGNLTNFQDLRLDFDLYYFSITNLATEGYLKVEYSLDGGGNWITLSTITSIQGNPNTWNKFSIPIPGPYVSTQFKVRFLLFAYADNLIGNSWKESIATVDNVKVYGNKPITTGFVWSGAASILYESTCTTLIGSTPTNSICIKPSATQIENDANWSITATANFTNGCPATKTIVVQNDTKTWDNPIATNNWSTNNWKPGGTGLPPSDTKCVIVKTPLIIQTGINGLAKNITIETGGKLNIFGSLKVTNEIISNVTATDVVVESDGNLIQVNEGININTGTITAKRTLNLSAGREQYNYLISPLEGQSLSGIYNNAGATAPSVLYHNEATNKFYPSSGAYIKGRGLAVKEPVKAFAPTTLGATFTGKPTNGTFSYTIVNSNNGDTNRGYNLIGNPYPSNIDLVTFYTLNGGETGNVYSTAYFWDNRANNKTTQQGDLYGGQSYGQLNMTSGTGTAGNGDATIKTKIPTQFVKTGQGFMVKTKVNNTSITFNNTIRTKESGPSFFGKTTGNTEASMDRYWLNMISPANIASNIAVVYFPEGNNAFTQDDSRTMGGSDAIYSMVENEKVSINGRSNFLNTDIIPLGSQHFAAGNYTITLGDKEGIFAEDQNIYLKDKQTGIITNLNAGDYTFSANAGESTGRFDIVYVPETVLATDAAVKEKLIVYRDGNDFVVKAQSKKITSLEVFDTAGRLILALNPNSIKAIVPSEKIVTGVYVLKINQNGQITSKKIIR